MVIWLTPPQLSTWFMNDPFIRLPPYDRNSQPNVCMCLVLEWNQSWCHCLFRDPLYGWWETCARAILAAKRKVLGSESAHTGEKIGNKVTKLVTNLTFYLNHRIRLDHRLWLDFWFSKHLKVIENRRLDLALLCLDRLLDHSNSIT